jgi:signal transduction histidine kinase
MSKLSEVLRGRRPEILQIWTASIRLVSGKTDVGTFELVDHLPRILDELIRMLEASAADDAVVIERTSTAGKHGLQRYRLGFDVQAVVREYGLLHRCLMEVAHNENVVPEIQERRILNDFIFTGVADALTQYSHQRDAELQRQANEHFAFVAHELRNPLASMELAIGSLRSRALLPPGPMTDLLLRSIERMDDLIQAALTLSLGRETVNVHRTRLALRRLVTDAVTDSAGASADKEIAVEAVGDCNIEVMADERLLRSALTNLVSNAVKFTRKGGRVRVRFHRDGDRAIVDVDDACGGLPAGAIEKMFLPFVQVGKDRSGFGLGLAIARQAIEAHGGSIRATDHPGEGCTMTIELPCDASAVEHEGGA